MQISSVHIISMRPHLLRPLLVLVFLLALNCWLAFWTLVGGAYHLELMAWPWKLFLSLAMASLVTMLTAALASARSTRTLAILIAAVMAVAGGVTYYYHLNEPVDGEDSGDEFSRTLTTTRASGATHSAVRARR